MQGHTIDLDLLAQHIPGGALDFGDDGRVLAGKGIQEAGLAGIGFAGDDHLHAVPQQGALVGFLDGAVQGLQKGLEIRGNLAITEEIHILVGKIDGGFHIDPKMDQLINES